MSISNVESLFLNGMSQVENMNCHFDYKKVIMILYITCCMFDHYFNLILN